MKLTNKEVWNAVPAIKKLAGKDMPVKTSLEVLRLAEAVNREFKTIESVRNLLIEKHGKRDKRGVASVGNKDAGYKQFVSDFNELMAGETDIDIKPITLPDQVGGKPFEFDAISIMALEKFITNKEI